MKQLRPFCRLERHGTLAFQLYQDKRLRPTESLATLISDAGDSGALDRFMAENGIAPDDPNAMIIHWTVVDPAAAAEKSNTRALA
jgi:hypothetical protein